MILETIKTDLKQAMLARDETKVSTLRFLLAQVQNRTIELMPHGGEITDEEAVGIIRKQVKRGQESIEAFKKGGREDLVSKEEKELKILKQYLPEEISEEELRVIIDETISELGANSPSDFGKVMGVVMGKVKGKVDGSTVSRLVKEKFG